MNPARQIMYWWDGRTDYTAGTAWVGIGINILLTIPKLMIEAAMGQIM